MTRARGDGKNVLIYTLSKNSNRILASSYLSVCAFVRNNSVPTGRILTKFNIGVLFLSFRRVLNVIYSFSGNSLASEF